MIERIEPLLKEIENVVISTSEELELYRLKYLSKKGIISQLFEEFKELPGDQKRDVGKPLNVLKNQAESS